MDMIFFEIFSWQNFIFFNELKKTHQLSTHELR